MFSLSYSNIRFASGLGLSSLCGCQQGIKRGTYEPAVRLQNFTEQVLLWGKREWVGTFPKECLPVWYLCYGNLKLEDKPGRPVKCKWQEAQESSYLLTPYRASKDKMSEFLPFVKTSFPGVLKAKLPRRCKGQESSRGKVTDLNPQNHLRCLLWKQTLTQKWQKQQTRRNSKTSENHVFCPSALANWIGSTHRGREGESGSPVLYLQLFTSIWTQVARDDKNVLHSDELKQHNFKNTGRNVLQQQSKWWDAGGSLCSYLLSRTAPYNTVKQRSFGQRKRFVFNCKMS